MAGIIEWLKGKKTFIIAILFLVFALLIAFQIAVPEFVYAILAAIGLSTFRLAIAEISGNTGWKTFAAAGIVFVIAILNALGIVLPYDVIYGICAALGIVGVRSAVSKL